MAECVFPQGFLWGCATSAHQVEGHNVHSDWWAWEQAGRVKERSGLACDQYCRFEQDFGLAASLGHNAHRFSIEWSRIEPEEGRWDDEALAHYVQVVRALTHRGLEPIVTLHHYTSPQWLTAKGGWMNPIVVSRFARYVERVADVLGREVRWWVTINEPMVFVRMHYVQGIGPPGVQDLRQALEAIRHICLAHAVAYPILHGANAEARVSIAHHVPAFTPCRWWHPADRLVARKTDALFNQALLDVLTEGRWRVPGVAAWQLPECRNTLDYLGLNYYGRQFIRHAPEPGRWPGTSCDLGHHPWRVRERTAFGWDVHPASFEDALIRFSSTLRLPILVTENGAWMADDADRWRYLRRHLEAMAKARQAGAEVIGYCCWSLLDNFEWADGFTPRFGIVEVNYATQERIVRDSGRRYAEVCKSGRLPHQEHPT